MAIIEEAIERAKRLQLERQRDVSSSDRPVQIRAPIRGRKLEVAGSTMPRLDYPELRPDLAVCEENKVLISPQSGGLHKHAVDAYRILRTRLRHRVGLDQVVSIGIVSAGANEGKSLTALNLALSFASEKRRNVFLIDLDLRNPSLCLFLGIAPNKEIAAYLANPGNPESVFFTLGVENLFVAGGITSHENSSELLGGSALAEMLDYVARSDPHALIIVDLPPILQSADAMVVGPNLSAMLLVVGEGITRRDNLGRALEMLGGMQVAGVVLNRSREAIEDYYG
jgi:protein-tyrosine kinase